MSRSRIHTGSEGRSATFSEGADTVERSKTATKSPRTPPGGDDKVPSSRRLTATEKPASRSRSTTPTQRTSLSESSRGRSKVPTAQRSRDRSTSTATARSLSATPTQRRAATTTTTPAKVSQRAPTSRKVTPIPRAVKASGDEEAPNTITTTPKVATTRSPKKTSGTTSASPKPTLSRLSPPTNNRNPSKGRLQGREPSPSPSPGIKTSPRLSPSISPSMDRGSKIKMGKAPLVSHSSSMDSGSKKSLEKSPSTPRRSSIGPGSTSTPKAATTKSPKKTTETAFDSPKQTFSQASPTTSTRRSSSKVRLQGSEPSPSPSPGTKMSPRSSPSIPQSMDSGSKKKIGKAPLVSHSSSMDSGSKKSSGKPPLMSRPLISRSSSMESVDSSSKKSRGKSPLVSGSSSMGRGSSSTRSKSPSAFEARKAYVRSLSQSPSSSKAKGKTKNKREEPTLENAKEDENEANKNLSKAEQAVSEKKNEDVAADDSPSPIALPIASSSTYASTAPADATKVSVASIGKESFLLMKGSSHEDLFTALDDGSGAASAAVVATAASSTAAAVAAAAPAELRDLRQGREQNEAATKENNARRTAAAAAVPDTAKAEREFLADAVRARKKQAAAEALAAQAKAEEESREAVGLGDKDPLLNKHFSHYATTDTWEEPKETKPVLSSSSNTLTEKQKEMLARQKEAEDVSRRQTKVQAVRDKVKASQAMREEIRKKISQAQIKMSEAEANLEHVEGKDASPFVHEAGGDEVTNTNTKSMTISDEEKAITQAVAVAADATKEEEEVNNTSDEEKAVTEAVGLGDLNKHFSRYATSDEREEPMAAKPVLGSSNRKTAVTFKLAEADQEQERDKQKHKSDGDMKKEQDQELRQEKGHQLEVGIVQVVAVPEAAELGVKAKTITLSEEETAMNGAPEGDLFVVEVLSRDKLPRFGSTTAETLSPVAEATAHLTDYVLPTLVGIGEEGTAKVDNAWNVDFDAITGLRRVLCYAPDALFLVSSTTATDAKEGEEGAKKVTTCYSVKDSGGCDRKAAPEAMTALLPSMAHACRAPRSSLAKNALCAAADLFSACGSENTILGNAQLSLKTVSQEVDPLVSALIDSTASNVAKSLRVAASVALDQAVSKETAPFLLLALLPCLARKAGHKNKDAAEASALFLDKALGCLLATPIGCGDTSEGRIDAGEAAKAKLVEEDVEWMFGLLLRAFSQSLNGKSPKAKAAAKQSVTRIQTWMGVEAFSVAIDAGVAALTSSTTSNGSMLTALQVQEVKDAGEKESVEPSETNNGKKAERTMSIREKMTELRSQGKTPEPVFLIEEKNKTNQDPAVV